MTFRSCLRLCTGINVSLSYIFSKSNLNKKNNFRMINFSFHAQKCNIGHRRMGSLLHHTPPLRSFSKFSIQEKWGKVKHLYTKVLIPFRFMAFYVIQYGWIYYKGNRIFLFIKVWGCNRKNPCIYRNRIYDFSIIKILLQL